MPDKKRQIRIGIDARFYGPRQKGLGRYVQELVNNLEQVVKEKDRIEFFIFLRAENWDQYQPKNNMFRKILVDCQWYGFKEQLLMPWKIRRAKINLMHFPHFNVPIFCFKPFVITIHDLILKRFPTRRASALNPISYWFKNLAYHCVISLAVRRAKKIIAVSNFTKQDIIRYFKVCPARIKVVYEGAPVNNVLGNEASGRKNSTFNLAELGIKKPYLLYVGNAYPHKNLENLVRAFIKINKKSQYQLVLVGEIDYFYTRLKNLISNLRIKGVILTDFVSDQYLPLLYQNALLYVFPSFCEGFGLPPLEAMSYQVPVVSSNASCLPEILGKAAEYFDPVNIDEMIKVISLLLQDKQRKHQLILKGERKIKEYSWLKMARQTLAVYQKQI